MKYTELTIHTNSCGAEIVGGVLTAAGISCWSVEDPDDLKELLQSGKVPYDYIERDLLSKTGGETLVKAYVTAGEDGEKQLLRIKRGICEMAASGGCGGSGMCGSLQTRGSLQAHGSLQTYGSLRVEEREVDSADWADSWKQYFHPLPIGERFVVRPTWESCEPAGRIVLTIDPGSSFGTGRHETTALCLRALEKLRLAGASVLDMGCGSGILAVAALKLGAKSAVLVDNDSAAVASANENLARNGVAERGRVLCGDVLEDGAFAHEVFGVEYDAIFANIVADTIIAMARSFCSALAQGGALICSGIIESRCGEVQKALRDAGFSELRTEYDKGWAAIVCTKATRCAKK